MATSHGTPNSSGRPAHPYLDFALASGFTYMGAREWEWVARAKDVQTWLPLLVEFRPGKIPRNEGETALAAFAQLRWLDSRFRESKSVKVPWTFLHPPAVLAATPEFNYCVLLVRHEAISTVIRTPEWEKIIMRADLGPRIFLPPPPKSTPIEIPPIPAKACPPLAQRTLTRAVIGIIDHGIAFAHPRFFNGNTSRIASIWLQDLDAVGTAEFPGKEFSAAEVQQALAKAKGDEEAVYKDLGVLDFAVDGYKALGRRRSHGTHVLDLAANENLDLGDETLPIIAVDMPDEAIGDPAGSTLTVHAAWGLVYLLKRAEEMRRNDETLPVVANISYGPHEGPHDGSAALERFMDWLTELTADSCTPLQVVLAAGNSRQSRTHASFELCASGTEELSWRLQPGSLTPSFMEIWLSDTPGADVEVTLTSPSTATLPISVSVDPGKPKHEFPGGGQPPLLIAHYVSAGVVRTNVLLFVAPTAADPESGNAHPVAEHGVWTVKIKNRSAHDLVVDAWIKRGDTQHGRRAKGRQSYFDDENYRRLDNFGRPVLFDPAPGTPTYVKRRNTLSGIATGKETIVVGGYRRSDNSPVSYTSAGGQAIVGRPHENPNWVSASDDARAHSGLLGAGTRAGAWCAMNGTSAAAPLTTRKFAIAWIAGAARPTLPLGGLKDPNRVPVPDRPVVTGRGLLESPRRRGRP